MFANELENNNYKLLERNLQPSQSPYIKGETNRGHIPAKKILFYVDFKCKTSALNYTLWDKQYEYHKIRL